MLSLIRRPIQLRAYTSAAFASTSSNSKLSPLALKAAEDVSSKWRGTTANGGNTKIYIGGEFLDSKTDKWLEVRDPVSSGQVYYAGGNGAHCARINRLPKPSSIQSQKLHQMNLEQL